jgi:murein DD-endopeptidase MepM/ murein hydrolase activator NlpD
MTTPNARLRVLLIGALAALCVGAVPATALADEGAPAAPRAVPLARALPRTYASYDDLLKTAAAVAADHQTLYARLLVARAERDLAKSILEAVTDPRLRGGFIQTQSEVIEAPAIAALRAQVATAGALEAQLIAGGAAPIAASPTWQRPLAGEISQLFGPTFLALEPARVYKGVFSRHFHEGVDIAALAGTPVQAPARGRVVFAGRMGDGAMIVVLAHDNGLVSLYAHLEDGPLAPTVKAGDIVEAGTRIGSVGLTGLTTGFHLHWAVYGQDGQPIDPLKTLGL